MTELLTEPNAPDLVQQQAAVLEKVRRCSACAGKRTCALLDLFVESKGKYVPGDDACVNNYREYAEYIKDYKRPIKQVRQNEQPI